MPSGVYPRTEFHKKALSSVRLGKHYSSKTEFKKGIIPWNRGKKHSEETKRKMSENHADFTREKHWNWKGGITRWRPKTKKKYIIWRLRVFERDNYTCQGCKKIGGDLEAHHIKPWSDYPKLRYKIENGITLCRQCHRLTFKKIK